MNFTSSPAGHDLYYKIVEQPIIDAICHLCSTVAPDTGMSVQTKATCDGPRLNVLVLHGIIDFAHERQTTIRHVRAFQRYAAGHRFAYQYVGHPVTDGLKSVPWDLVLFDATFLSWRWVRPRAAFERVKAGIFLAP